MVSPGHPSVPLSGTPGCESSHSSSVPRHYWRPREVMRLFGTSGPESVGDPSSRHLQPSFLRPPTLSPRVGVSDEPTDHTSECPDTRNGGWLQRWTFVETEPLSSRRVVNPMLPTLPTHTLYPSPSVYSGPSKRYSRKDLFIEFY